MGILWHNVTAKFCRSKRITKLEDIKLLSFSPCNYKYYRYAKTLVQLDHFFVKRTKQYRRGSFHLEQKTFKLRSPSCGTVRSMRIANFLQCDTGPAVEFVFHLKASDNIPAKNAPLRTQQDIFRQTFSDFSVIGLILTVHHRQ